MSPRSTGVNKVGAGSVKNGSRSRRDDSASSFRRNHGSLRGGAELASRNTGIGSLSRSQGLSFTDAGKDSSAGQLPNNSLQGAGPVSSRALGIRAGSVSSYDDEDGVRKGRTWAGATRLHRVSSLEGNKVLMNLAQPGAQGPKEFREFENHGIIGEGAFSDVYKVRNPYDGKFYAVKRSKKRIKNKSDRSRYPSRAKMFQRLGISSNVLRYYSAWQEEGYFYTRTELCSGGNLKNLLEVSAVVVACPDPFLSCQCAVPTRCAVHHI